MAKVYLIKYGSDIKEAFSTKEKAQAWLKTKHDEIRYKPGVDCLELTDTKVSWLFGWEEHLVAFRIEELELK